MEHFRIPRIMVAGAWEGAGTSLVTLGLAYELRRQNLSVSAMVVGPRLFAAQLFRRVTGRYTRVVDEHLATEAQILTAAYQASIGADILLLEGHGGLFDGDSVASLFRSSASYAKLLGAPVALVVDVRGLRSSLGALVRGFAELVHDVSIRAVVANYVGGVPSERGTIGSAGRHPYQLPEYSREDLAATLQFFRAPPLVGALPRLNEMEPMPPAEIHQFRNATVLARQFLVDLGQVVREAVDVDALVRIAAEAPAIDLPDYQHTPLPRRCRIAVADDSCFNVAFQDNFDLLRYFGAEIVSFSPLADEALPERIGAVYLPGAFLPEYGSEVARNEDLKASIKQFADRGGVIYSEGAGTAFLCRDFRIDPKEAPLPGVGLIDAEAHFHAGRMQFVDVTTVDESPLGRSGLQIKGVQTGEWHLRGEDRIIRVLRVTGSGPATHDGLSPTAQSIATFDFLNFASNPILAKNLVDAAEVVAKIGGTAE